MTDKNTTPAKDTKPEAKVVEIKAKDKTEDKPEVEETHLAPGSNPPYTSFASDHWSVEIDPERPELIRLAPRYWVGPTPIVFHRDVLDELIGALSGLDTKD